MFFFSQRDDNILRIKFSDAEARAKQEEESANVPTPTEE